MAKIFPIYFSMQTALPAVMALTYPGSKNPFGSAGGVSGVLDPSNRWSVLAPLASAFLCSLGNLVFIGPATTKCMDERRQQGRLSWLVDSSGRYADNRAEKKDGKKSYDPPPHSQEMVALNKKFSMLHGISSLLNLGTFIASVVYGVTLSSRLS
jgi:hypothetical protein